MTELFVNLLNMSVTASYIVIFVILLRLIFKKAPKSIHVFLWALVGARLVFPFSFESSLSLIPETEVISPRVLLDQTPEIGAAAESVITVAPEKGVNALKLAMIIFSRVWVVGAAVMILYAIVSLLKIHKKLRESAPLCDNIFICDCIDTPFILGVTHPKIYLPSDLNEADTEYVVAHEKMHLQRFDHLWKPLGFLLLTVYWFNPMMWIAYILLCRDIELACDEKVINDMGGSAKKMYSNALINCSAPRKTAAPFSLAFGEVNVKSRIKSILNYKKPAFWITVVAVVSIASLSVCFLTNPKNDPPVDNPPVEDEQLDGILFDDVTGFLGGDKPYIKASFTNTSYAQIYFSEDFVIRKDNKIYEPKRETNFDLPLNYMGPQHIMSQTFDLSAYDFEDGQYTLEKTFWKTSDTSAKQYKASFDFIVDGEQVSFAGSAIYE